MSNEIRRSRSRSPISGQGNRCPESENQIAEPGKLIESPYSKWDEYYKRIAMDTKQRVKINGMLFGGLREIPVNEAIDPPPRACFNCWQYGHNRKACPKPYTCNYCFNCGRRRVKMVDCPRCSEAHALWDSQRTNKDPNRIWWRMTEGNFFRLPQMPETAKNNLITPYTIPPTVNGAIVNDEDYANRKSHQLGLVASLNPDAQAMVLQFFLGKKAAV